MKKFLLLSALLAPLFFWHSAEAATCDGAAIPGMLVGSNGSVCTYLKVNSDGSLSVVTASPSGGTTVTPNPLTAVAGTQRGLSIAAATAPTIPATATYLLAQPQGTNNSSGVCLFWQDDGTDPTASAGQALSALQPLWRKVTSDGIKFIAATSATCTVTISYYKDTP